LLCLRSDRVSYVTGVDLIDEEAAKILARVEAGAIADAEKGIGVGDKDKAWMYEEAFKVLERVDGIAIADAEKGIGEGDKDKDSTA